MSAFCSVFFFLFPPFKLSIRGRGRESDVKKFSVCGPKLGGREKERVKTEGEQEHRLT